ncbi:hypothetical protein IAQ61_002307 [Plenodomus lingam]|uniref:uncharacterized protein n=1 Tax=Leptosphaeria maculans TaxID=5022 RepID=UPI00331A4621|nr:hypothetical protein IAQ61_002307 [Plenodomus lingam]
MAMLARAGFSAKGHVAVKYNVDEHIAIDGAPCHYQRGKSSQALMSTRNLLRPWRSGVSPVSVGKW